MIILDTNVISELLRPSPDLAVLRWFEAVDDRVLATATPVLAELMSGVALLPSGRRSTQLRAAVLEFLASFEGRILPFDQAAAFDYAALVAERSRAGRPAAAVDLMIAAIARSQGASVATRDVDGLTCSGLVVVDPWAS